MILLLPACAIQPGQFVVDPVRAAASRLGDAPEGALIPITPELIAKQRAERDQPIPPAVEALFAEPTPYQIGPGDVLNLVVLDQPELSGGQGNNNNNSSLQGLVVDEAGRIQFPFVGELAVAGLSVFEARELVKQTLREYIRDPVVTLRVQTYRSGRVYMEGAVGSQLLVIDEVPMTLPEALARAGVSRDRNAVAITREGVTTLVNPVLLAERGINPARVLLKNGDMVRVLTPEEQRIFVLGEVPRSSAQNLINGRLSLYQALASAGGVNPGSGNSRQIYVIRPVGQAEKPEIYHVATATPLAFALTQGFELKANDVVYVDPVPLVRWNRVISLILPSANAILVSRAVEN